MKLTQSLVLGIGTLALFVSVVLAALIWDAGALMPEISYRNLLWFRIAVFMFGGLMWSVIVYLANRAEGD